MVQGAPIEAGQGSHTAGATRGTEKKKAPHWVSLAEAAEITKLSEKTLRRQIKKGTLKAKKGPTVNSKIQVDLSEDFLSSVLRLVPVEESDDIDLDVQDFEPEAEATKSQTIEFDEQDSEDFSPRAQASQGLDLAALQLIASEMVKPLMQRVEELVSDMREKDKVIRLTRIHPSSQAI